VDFVYIELLVTATAVQRDLANAYTQSGRLPELGQYFRALSLATTYFFEQIEPSPEFRRLHNAFIHWQKLGQEALREELEAGEPVHSDLTRQHLEASQQFADVLAELAGKT
jgi:hypothetical protein